MVKRPIKVARISTKQLDRLLELGYVVIIAGWGKVNRRIYAKDDI